MKHALRSKHGNAALFALTTGLRRGEICALKWRDIDPYGDKIYVRNSRYQLRGVTGEKVTKSGKPREVTLYKEAREVLIAEREKQILRIKHAGDSWENEPRGHIFTDDRGRPLSPMALTSAFKRLACWAKLPTQSFHSLRHTAATQKIGAGVSLIKVQKELGHADISTTLKYYGHVLPQDEEKAQRAVSDAFADIDFGRSLGRNLPSRSKNARQIRPGLVAPTGIEL